MLFDSAVGKTFQGISRIRKAIPSYYIPRGVLGHCLLWTSTPTYSRARDFLRPKKLDTAAAGFMEVQVQPVLVEALGSRVEELTASIAALGSYGAPAASTETSNTERAEGCHRECLSRVTPPGTVGAGYNGDHRKL